MQSFIDFGRILEVSTFTEERIRRRAQRNTSLSKTAKKVLIEEVAAAKARSIFDVFLSHSTLDSEIILGVKGVLEDYGKTVYVDWLEDPQLDRAQVTSTTAAVIRERMRQCKSLVYVHTTNSRTSKWMPWELGYFDGFRRTVAIFPVTTIGSGFSGQEYLGIYPYIDEAREKGGSINKIWVNRSSKFSSHWDAWIADPLSFERNG